MIDGVGERGLFAPVGVEEFFAVGDWRTVAIGWRLSGNVGPALLPFLLGHLRGEGHCGELGDRSSGRDQIFVGLNEPGLPATVSLQKADVARQKVPAERILFIQHRREGSALGLPRQPAPLDLRCDPSQADGIRQQRRNEHHGSKPAEERERPADALVEGKIGRNALHARLGDRSLNPQVSGIDACVSAVCHEAASGGTTARLTRPGPRHRSASRPPFRLAVEPTREQGKGHGADRSMIDRCGRHLQKPAGSWRMGSGRLPNRSLEFRRMQPTVVVPCEER